jgi:membrane fusion protein
VSRDLFRKETQDARASSWLGRIVLIRPVSFSVMTMTALVLAACLGAYFIEGHYTRKARLVGVLAPAQGIVRIVAPQAGVVAAVHVREGDPVARDTLLFVIADARTASRTHDDAAHALGTRVRQRQRSLEEQRLRAIEASQAERAGLARRLDAMRREIRQVDSELDAQAERMGAADRNYERSSELNGVGFVSAAAVDRERENQLEQRSRFESLKRAAFAMAREAADAESELALSRARLRSSLATIDVQAAALEQEALERELQYRSVVAAPGDGYVGAVVVEPGQMVLPGTALATLLPADNTLEAHLYSPSKSIGFVKVGQEVLLRYQAYPHQKFGSHRATVTAISANAMNAVDLNFVPLDGSREPLYRIKAMLGEQAVDAYGRREPLQPGMQVEADVMLDRRRLIEWVFEPLLSLAGRA